MSMKKLTKRTAVAGSTVPLPTLTTRSSGVLLHVSSLPGPAPVGDLGPSARAFVDFLATAGQRWWQMLPVNPIGAGWSPYSTISSFAGETLFISAEDLLQDRFVTKNDVAYARSLKAPRPKLAVAKQVVGKKVAPPAKPSTSKARADYHLAQVQSEALLRKAFERSFTKLQGVDDTSYADFVATEKVWLEDYALFAALAGKFGTPDWSTWPGELKRRDPNALHAARVELEREIEYHGFVQYLFDKQWRTLREYAHDRGVALIGDIPIFVAYASADVWANQKYFFLDEQSLRPTFVAGCPPDAFNADGQLWGNALYRWDVLSSDGYGWWIDRLRRILELFDAVRLDHFIGFSRYWRIPADAKTAREGTWMPVPGEDLFATVKKTLGEAPFIAEDLGAVTPQVRALRDQFGFPGMKVLQFGFDGSEESKVHAAHLMPEASVVYTGTHDNDTTRGWFNSLKARAKKDESACNELARIVTYFATDDKRVHYDMMTAGFGSRANVVITPVQDILGLGGEYRMNVPGVADGNWAYRVRPGELSDAVAYTLRELTNVYHRA